MVAQQCRLVYVVSKKILNNRDFCAARIGQRQAGQIYHYPLLGEVKRLCNESNAEIPTWLEKHRISSSFILPEFFKRVDFGLKRREGYHQ
jgi:hypothetical protein